MIKKIKWAVQRRMYTYYNRIYLFIKGVKFGHNCKFYDRLPVFLESGGTIIIGNNVAFTSGGFHNPLCRNINGCMKVEKGAFIKIGNNTGISSACIWAHKKIVIGNNVKIGGDCIILDSNAHSLHYLERRFDETDLRNKISKEIVIGDDVLIGTRTIILKGVHIGNRSIIGAGSVVSSDIPADCIAAGNPCKIIKFLKV